MHRLRWYLTTVAHVGLYWFIGNRLYLTPTPLPRLDESHTGTSIVPWRYHFNTVTFSYTAAFWTWEDWELQLDWMALRGINLPLAWVGQEKILMDVFLDAGFTPAEVLSFLSGPAFQAWNRFGNIQGSWDAGLPISWIEGQFELQKKIVARMVELGMTPVLPCFTGFVPRAIDRVSPDAAFVNGSQWNGFPSSLTNVTFVEPTDPLFSELQISFISKQTAAYGKVTNIYTLDQYNENSPQSGDLDYLRNVTSGTWASLKAADPEAIWMMQGWLFYSNSDFWTDERIEAYLSGVTVDSDILILDLFSESHPQWQRTDSYYGKPWIWCQLHDYGGNMGIYGQVENVTINPIEALSNSSSLVGLGLTMEGQEGNEIMYDILLDQAWSAKPLNTSQYSRTWVEARYASVSLPPSVHEAWDLLRTTAYNNTNFDLAQAVTKSIFELAPNTTGLLNRTGEHGTIITYDPQVMTKVWALMHNAASVQPSLLEDIAFMFDLTDVTRQLMTNAFTAEYTIYVVAANSSINETYSPSAANIAGKKMLGLLSDLDSLLLNSGVPYFSLSTWIGKARAWAMPETGNSSSHISNVTAPSQTAALYEYNARNQITLWGPTGEITDYASRQWGGLIGSYYLRRWGLFINHTKPISGIGSAAPWNGENEALSSALLAFEEHWNQQTWGEDMGGSFAEGEASEGGLVEMLAKLMARYPELFGAYSVVG